MHLPHPPKGDHPEKWKANIRAFNVEFQDVLFEGYSRAQINEWIKREMVDTAEVTSIARISLDDLSNNQDGRTKQDTIRAIIEEKKQYYLTHITGLETVIKEAEIQASLFDDQAPYIKEREVDIQRYTQLIKELDEILACQIHISED